MTKQELAKLVLTEDELKNIDFAYPLEWANVVRTTSLNLGFIVWSYIESRGHRHGHPLDLAHLYFEKFGGKNE